MTDVMQGWKGGGRVGGSRAPGGLKAGVLRPLQDDSSQMKPDSAGTIQSNVAADPSQDAILALMSSPGLVCLCASEQEEESERGMWRDSHGREGARRFSSHAPVAGTKTNMTAGQQQQRSR